MLLTPIWEEQQELRLDMLSQSEHLVTGSDQTCQISCSASSAAAPGDGGITLLDDTAQSQRGVRGETGVEGAGDDCGDSGADSGGDSGGGELGVVGVSGHELSHLSPSSFAKPLQITG
ncbi:unnamed protein product [Closterium sp. NIES-65]|nr:unnamed protein product [Closterium sp. NIES-65]